MSLGFLPKSVQLVAEQISFRDYVSKEHMIEIGPSPSTDIGDTCVYLTVDHHQAIFPFKAEKAATQDGQVQSLDKAEIFDLAKAGDI